MSENKIKQKKIGCVIAYAKNHNNYGTSLQGYATLKKINDFGYDFEVIHYIKKNSIFNKLKLLIPMILSKSTKGMTRTLKEKINKKIHKSYAKNILIRTQAVNAYKEKKILPYFKEYIGYEALCRGSKNYKLVLVGSDQLWLPMSLYGKYYNLLFVDNSVPKIAYASSFGVSQIPSFQLKATKKYLNRFNRIGVRELQGKNIVETVSDNKAKVVVDPTMLLTREEWSEEIKNLSIKSKEPYILSYLLGTNILARKAINELKTKTGLKIIAIRHLDEYIPNDEFFGDEAPYDVSPNDFVKLISEAKYVCTDSLHCTIFSILFHRKFMTFYRFNSKNINSRNSRIDSLLKILKLQDRLYINKIEKIMNSIDYNNVDDKLNALRIESLSFLKNSLNLSN